MLIFSCQIFLHTDTKTEDDTGSCGDERDQVLDYIAGYAA